MFHQITLVGRLTRDPEMRYMPDGKAITNFNMAVDGYKKGETLWFRVSVFGKQAEAVHQYLKKGAPALVVGTLSHESGNPKIFTRQDGTAGASFEVVANSVRFLGGSKSEDGDGGAPTAKPVNAVEDEYEDVPF